MAAELGWVGLGVSPDFTGFKGQVDRETAKVMGAAGVHGGEEFGTSAGKSAGSKFKSAIKSAAKVAAVGLAAAGALAIKFGGDALEEAREAQKVGALTTSTIKATGGAAKVTAKHVADLSGAISEKVGIDDEVIQRGANMVLTFKNIRNEAGKGNKVFDRTTQAITDMAAGMAGGSGEIDLKSSSILMGKALNDPVKGLTALGRVGVAFTDQQKAINLALVEGGDVAALNALGMTVTEAEFKKAMEDRKATAEETVRFFAGPMSDSEKKYFDHLAEGGHTLEAQKNILKEVNSQFGGAAEAQATDADKMKVAWGNFKEEVGTELLPVMDDLTNFLRKKGIPAARDFFDWVKDTGVPAMKDFADEIKPVAGHVKDLAGFLNDLPSEVKIGGLTGLAALFVGSKLRGGRGGLLGGAGSALGMTRPIPVLVTNPGFGGGGGGAGDGGGFVGGGGDGKKSKGRRRRPRGGGGSLAAALLFAPHESHAAEDLYPHLNLPDDFDHMPKAARKALNATATEFRNAKIPTEVRTDIALYGAPDSLRQAKALAHQYNLTPPEKKTLFRVLDVESSKRATAGWQDVLGKTPQRVITAVGLSGVGQAHRQIDGLMGALGDFAAGASDALDAAGDLALGRGRNGPRPRNHGRDRQRAANLGGPRP